MSKSGGDSKVNCYWKSKREKSGRVAFICVRQYEWGPERGAGTREYAFVGEGIHDFYIWFQVC